MRVLDLLRPPHLLPAARSARIEPLPGPEPPTGPPPTFAANILEAQEKQRRAGPDLLSQPVTDAPLRTERAAWPRPGRPPLLDRRA